MEMDFEVVLVVVGLVAANFVDEDLKEFGLRPFFVLVLKGLATGARLGSPLVAEDFAGGCFLEASDAARAKAPPKIARTRSTMARRFRCIYCTPAGLAALSGLVEVSEMTGAGSFGWGPG